MKQRFLYIIASLLLTVLVTEITVDFSSATKSNLDLAEVVIDAEEEIRDGKGQSLIPVVHNLWFEIMQTCKVENSKEFRTDKQPEKTVTSWNVPLYLEDCVFLI